MGALLAILLGANFISDKFIWGYAILFLSTLAIHYHNDYFDYQADQFVTPTPISGGSGILIENPQWRELSKKIAITLILLAITLSVAFTIIFSYTYWFIIFVIFANLLSWFYAAPPLKLSYRGVGEFGNTAIGLLFPGLGYFTLMGTLDLTFLIFAIPIIFWQLMFTSSVEIPDMEGDKLGGKNTWIVTRGRSFGFKLIAMASFLATLSFILMPYTPLFPSIINFQLLTLISLIPLTLGIIEIIKRPVNKKTATPYCIYNLASIFTAIILINCYFIYLIK
jgi:1,4-dihydroxy-2-naphthoate octaprenyltransferase